MVLVMKFIGFKLSAGKIDSFRLFSTPLLEEKTFKISRANPKYIDNSVLIFDQLVATLGVLFLYSFYPFLWENYYELNEYKPYLLLPLVYVLTAFIGCTTRILSSLVSCNPPPMHNKAYLSASASEFWLIRWNLWVRNWLHIIGKSLVPNSPELRKFIIFAVSGIFHEIMFSLPYFLLTNKNVFGSMTLYFLIQYIACFVDKEVLKKEWSTTRHLFLYFALFAPAPLFINDAFLYFLGP